MLCVVRKYSNECINENLRYMVWDSDDLSIEEHTGIEIIKAYKGGIKFANISKVRNRDMLYISNTKVDVLQYYKDNIIETEDIYCITGSLHGDTNSKVVLTEFQGTVYLYYKCIDRGKFSLVPAVIDLGTKKDLLLIDMKTGKTERCWTRRKMTRAMLKRALLIRGLDETTEFVEGIL